MLSNMHGPGFDAIIGQQLPKRILQRFVYRATVPHALLFTGIAGVGKRSMARIFAMALNCQERAMNQDLSTMSAEPCGRCRSCRHISEGRHPDIIELVPRKGVLRIDQVRNLLSVLTMKPFSAKHRIVIIAEAQTMNPEAGNALLKMLEEPPADTTLILTALQRSDLLATIASRCRHIRFAPLAPDDLAGLLVEKKGIAPERALPLAQAASGSYSKAAELASAQWGEQRDWVVRAAGLDQRQSLKKRSCTLALAFSASLAARKEKVDGDLEILKTWIRDLSVFPYQPRRLHHSDRADRIQDVRMHISDQQLTALWDTVAKAQKAIAANGNLRLTLDVMTLHMAQIVAT